MMTLANAQALQLSYQPNAKTAARLHGKSLIMLVGPVATGKTRILKQVATMASDFGPVSVLTTRDQRPDDDLSMFRYLPHDEAHLLKICEKIENGGFINYAIHPTSKRLYATEAQDFPKKYNLLATLSGAVEQLSGLPFERTIVTSLVCAPETWQKWLAERFPEENDDKQKRLEEAIQSLEWLLEHQASVMWVENIPGHPEHTAQSVIDAVLYNKKSDKALYLAEQMLEQAREML